MKAEADTLNSVRQDLERMQRRFEEEFSHAKGTEQRFLELDTTEKSPADL
jgi:hypothetical protein